MLNENDVVEALCTYLSSQGYEIVQRCRTTERGIDIIAKHPNKRGRLLIEAKGGRSAQVGSKRYVAGFNSGQVRHQVAMCLYTAACTYSEHQQTEDTVVAMAFPDSPTFRTYLDRAKAAITTLGVRVFLIQPDRSVVMF